MEQLSVSHVFVAGNIVPAQRDLLSLVIFPSVTRDSSQAETERQIEQNEEPSKKKIKKELEASNDLI